MKRIAEYASEVRDLEEVCLIQRNLLIAASLVILFLTILLVSGGAQ